MNLERSGTRQDAGRKRYVDLQVFHFYMFIPFEKHNSFDDFIAATLVFLCFSSDNRRLCGMITESTLSKISMQHPMG